MENFDTQAASDLVENATKVIKSLKARVNELEAQPRPSNALAAEGTPVTKSANVWARDMAAEVDEEERGQRN